MTPYLGDDDQTRPNRKLVGFLQSAHTVEPPTTGHRSCPPSGIRPWVLLSTPFLLVSTLHLLFGSAYIPFHISSL